MEAKYMELLLKFTRIYQTYYHEDGKATIEVVNHREAMTRINIYLNCMTKSDPTPCIKESDRNKNSDKQSILMFFVDYWSEFIKLELDLTNPVQEPGQSHMTKNKEIYNKLQDIVNANAVSESELLTVPTESEKRTQYSYITELPSVSRLPLTKAEKEAKQLEKFERSKHGPGANKDPRKKNVIVKYT